MSLAIFNSPGRVWDWQGSCTWCDHSGTLAPVILRFCYSLRLVSCCLKPLKVQDQEEATQEESGSGSHSSGKSLVSWPHLTARKTGKCSLVCSQMMRECISVFREQLLSCRRAHTLPVMPYISCQSLGNLFNLIFQFISLKCSWITILCSLLLYSEVMQLYKLYVCARAHTHTHPFPVEYRSLISLFKSCLYSL